MLVQVENLVKRYGDLVALDHFSLTVEEGEIFGLLGPNGSGKTTAINCMLALLKYSKGSVRLFGRPMEPDSYATKQDIGIIMQNVAVINEMTVQENVDYFCGLYVPQRKHRQELVEEALDFVGLTGYRRFYPKKLSGGLLRRLNIACGIAHKPKLIFLDEPTVAVDPQSRNNILEGIMRLNREGATIIYTSHYMEEVEQICSRIAIMDRGQVIASGTSDQLKSTIRTGEKITAELLTPNSDLVEAISRLPHIVSVEYTEPLLVIKAERSQNTLSDVIDFFQQKNVAFGRLYCERPTLNDVFLEITGKELRD